MKEQAKIKDSNNLSSPGVYPDFFGRGQGTVSPGEPLLCIVTNKVELLKTLSAVENPENGFGKGSVINKYKLFGKSSIKI